MFLGWSPQGFLQRLYIYDCLFPWHFAFDMVFRQLWADAFWYAFVQSTLPKRPTCFIEANFLVLFRFRSFIEILFRFRSFILVHFQILYWKSQHWLGDT